MSPTAVPFNPFDLRGRVAMVTGCNTGIGAGIAVALARAGADIVGVNRSEPTETALQVRALGRRFVAVRADLASTSAIPGVMEQALADMGHVDVLVNNAGIIRRADALDFSEEDWDAVMDTNLKTLFFLSQSVARHMLARGVEQGGAWRGGKIINIASLLSFQGGIRVPSYTAAKSGVLGLTRLLANEWAAKGINVNAIAPGYIETNNTEALRKDAGRTREILQRIPAGRWGAPEDLGGAAVFLASSAADYVHGHTLAVDGGWLAR
ncbi:2-dehydro-3-deoxy-D-gluconate 5-dehydrogenase KduD [Comamonas odontotermitis]|uniref:2-dehydro-3-deoxy-D-gluconate 5-dehydrogenase KduD n=1 Tax=Comamonas odontotermitis TaxID=379895 RepID=UPI001CC4F13F|nr:2-dehydro-3-deoxy-D-gluconate 5-dehydrogenase KduD [Comamonas odontotermitis]UBB15671.1 2-dehydro-3-deoxy-D-gluconate 5-dehydrogenase KduD [Comamonas odontotermitis]